MSQNHSSAAAIPTSTHSRWGVYFKERFPIIPNVLVAWGMILSSARLALPANASVPKVEFTLALIGGIIFLAQMRLMDELKDFEKDKIAHPDRPLPRGLFSPEEFSRWIRIFQATMFGIAILACFTLNLTAGFFFAFGTFYLYLMYREFFVGTQLARSPILYAITHQVITVPMIAFGFSAFEPQSYASMTFVWFCLMLVSAFFAFEVGRKLDPKAHPLLGTYLTTYGRSKTALLLLVLLGILMWSATNLGWGKVMIPFGLISLCSLSLLWIAPQKYKWAEGWITLTLLASLWVIAIGGNAISTSLAGGTP